MLNKIVANIRGIDKAEKSDGTTFRIKFTGGLDAQERILGDLVKMKIGIVSYRPASSALEEAYLSLVKSTL